MVKVIKALLALGRVHITALWRGKVTQKSCSTCGCFTRWPDNPAVGKCGKYKRFFAPQHVCSDWTKKGV